MIVGSLLLILIAVTLLVLGLANGSSVLLISSIAASLLAAVALVAGARQAAAARADDELGSRAGDEGEDPAHRWIGAGTGGSSRRAASTGRAEPVEVTVPAQHAPGVPRTGPARRHRPTRSPEPPAGDRGSEARSAAGESLADEPAPQYLPAADAARIARMLTEVLVIDGRPRYHLPGCRHLHGRVSEPLPVREAVELGFTPCGRCRPGVALLADARHV